MPFPTFPERAVQLVLSSPCNFATHSNLRDGPGTKSILISVMSITSPWRNGAICSPLRRSLTRSRASAHEISKLNCRSFCRPVSHWKKKSAALPPENTNSRTFFNRLKVGRSPTTITPRCLLKFALVQPSSMTLSTDIPCRVFRLLDMVRGDRCQSPPASAGAEFYGMSQVELVCIKLGESTAPGGKKFWKTCTFRTFCTRQSWERIGPALGSGALSGNHFCTQLAPYAPVCGVSGISWMPLNRRRP